jgi:hypothetical protein
VDIFGIDWAATAYAIYQYIQFVRMDGDWLNDWLSHIPELLRPYYMAAGQAIAAAQEAAS